MKKHSLTLISVILVVFSLSGQNFISTEKQWNVRLLGFPGGYSTEIFRIEGDSLVDSVLYNKIWVSRDSAQTWFYQGLLREDSNVVYYKPADGSEGILYDFNLQAGDTAWVKNVFCQEEIPVYIKNVDTVEYFGISHKRWNLTEEGQVEEYWVEGIGSLNGPLYTKYWYCIICPVWELLCYHDGDTLLYIFPDETECYQNTVGIEENSGTDKIIIRPNPVKRGNPVEILLPDIPVNISLCNSSGIPVRNIPHNGSRNVKVETGNLEPGLYLMVITSAQNKIRTVKLLVQ